MWSRFSQSLKGLQTACPLCHATADRNGLCAACTHLLPQAGHACQQCGLPIKDSAADRCGECLASPPSFDAALIPFIYAPPIDDLIARLKYQGELSTGRLLAAQLAQEAIGSGRQVELIIPVPLHRQRLHERGFNQAAELSRTLSLKTGIPWSPGRLIRSRIGSTQRESNRRERMRNVRNAFQWAGRRPCPARVALVDDVVTTGATARAAAAGLKQAGAEWVEIWALARTPKG